MPLVSWPKQIQETQHHHQPLSPPNCYISYRSKKTIKLQKKKNHVEHPLTLNEAAKHEGDEAG